MDSFLDDYVDDVSSRVVVLGMYGSEPKFKFPHYRHRFPRSRLHEALKLYDAVWINASYGAGVFITLTMNPKKYTNLYTVSRKFLRHSNTLSSIEVINPPPLY